MTRKLLLMKQLLAEQKMKAAMEANAKKENETELQKVDVPGVNKLQEIEETTEDTCQCECKETCECENCGCSDECAQTPYGADDTSIDDTDDECAQTPYGADDADIEDTDECPCLLEPENESAIPDAKFVPEEAKPVEDEQPAPKKKRGRAKKSK